MDIEDKLKEQIENGNDFIADVSNLYFEKSKLDIKLSVDGILPKFMKVYTEKELVTISNDGKTFIEANIKYTRLFDWLYNHVSGNDIEHWMLFELKDVADFSKYCC